MTPPTRFSKAVLVRRTIVHHFRAYALVLLAAAVAAAVLTGALIVGDSIRGSLAARVEERLGAIDFAVLSAGWFREGLATDLAREMEKRAARDAPDPAFVPAVVLAGSVTHAGSRARASEVNVVGAPAAFWDFWRGPGPAPAGLQEGWGGRRAALNETLAAALGAKAGDAILIHLQKETDVPAEHALGRREGTVEALRLEVEVALPDEGLALFDLRNGQGTARNVFVPIEVLQRALDRQDLANAVLVASNSRTAVPAGAGLSTIAGLVRRVWKLEDAGLKLTVDGDLGHASLESRALILPPAAVEAARAAAHASGAEATEVLTYLANTLAVAEREVPYSTITAVPAVGGIEIRPGAIVLNDWTAQNLSAKPGDTVRVAYHAVSEDHRLVEKQASFVLQAVVPLAGEAADPGWTPEYPGISDAKALRDWDPPFPVDLKRVKDRDEEYWKLHRTTPKAFVSLAGGQELWSSRFGELTSVRFRLRPGVDAPRVDGAGIAPDPLSQLARGVRALILRTLEPGAAGIAIRAVKAEGLEAARGGTDFGVLFLSFSVFIVVSALVLLSMVFRLACQGRAHELGVLLAAGFSPRELIRLLLMDGALVAAGGAVLGVAGGMGYASALVAGLRTWWKDAVNAPFLALHVTAGSLLAGAGTTIVLATLTVLVVARRAARTSPRVLLGGTMALEAKRQPRGRGAFGGSLGLAGLAGLGAVALVATGAVPGGLSPEAAFFGAGACLLVAWLALVHRMLLRAPRGLARAGGRLGQSMLGIRYAGRSPARSLLTAILIASASFVIVTVAASRRDPGASIPKRDSGDGGFALAARASIPLAASLATREGRDTLNLTPETSALLDRAKVFAFRVRPGDDSSCLNLYRPQAPRILGAPRAFLERGGFAWQATSAPGGANPWRLLDEEVPGGAVPVVGDANTVTWILHSGLGKDIPVVDGQGREAKLRIVGLLAHSILQGELVTSEKPFLRLFPGISGHGFFLFESSVEDSGPLAAGLEGDLSQHGLDVEPTGEILRGYQAVENTYLSTFQVLGGLGLLLGTLGLGAVLLRNVNERRGELALIRAVGFSRRAIAWIVLSETAFLLTSGLVGGAGSAAVAVLPSVLGRQAGVSWTGLAGTLVLVLVAGFASSFLALRAALRAPLIPALRGE